MTEIEGPDLLTRADILSAAAALAIHLGIGYSLLRASREAAPKKSLIEVDVRTRAPEPPRSAPVEPKAEAPAQEPPRRRLPKRSVASSPPRQTAPQKSESEEKPVFGISMDSATTGESSVSIPVGNTIQIDPSRSAPRNQPVTPLSGGGSGAGPPGPLSIRSLPEIDTDACGRSATYPKGAQDLGIEGDVRLRVTLDERGAVREVRVLSSLGHGLDQEAVNAIRNKCKFTPAIASDGRPVPYVIESYVFHFEIPR